MKKEEAKKIINVKKKKIDIAKDICIEEKTMKKIYRKKSWFLTFTIGAFYHHGHDFSNNAWNSKNYIS